MATAQSKSGNGNGNGKAAEAAESAQVSDLYEQINALKADITGLVTLIKDVGQGEARRAVDTATYKAEDLREAGERQLRELKQQSEAQISELKAQAEGYGREAGMFVKEQPLHALGLAAIIGFILGLFMNNRR